MLRWKKFTRTRSLFVSKMGKGRGYYVLLEVEQRQSEKGLIVEVVAS